MTIAGGGIESARGTRAVQTDAGFGVLATKIQPPWQRKGIIERPTLMTRLRSSQAPVVAFIAPAGYGKSTAAAQFANVVGPRVAWLSADARDGDAATLLRGIAGAISRVAPLPPDMVDQVAAPGPSVWHGAVARVGCALGDLSDLTLVIDDVDRIVDREAVDILLALTESLSRPGRLVLTGRTLGALPVARLVTRGVLAPFGRDDLAFDAHEVAAVLSAAGYGASADEIEAIVERTEGWAAGVYLTAMTSSDADRRALELSTTGPDRLIEDYLSTEVVGAMDPADAEHLLSWSVLDQLNGELCDAILGREGSGADLDRLERTNLFVIPLDRERKWFRLHHLLGDHLRSELERTDPQQAAQLRRRAAAWCETHGMEELALEYAIAAEDDEHASLLALSVAQPTMNAGRTETVRRWFSWLEARDAGIDRPRLAATASMSFAFDGDVERAMRWADMVDRAPLEGVDDIDAGVVAIGRACLMRGRLADLIEDAAVAERTVPDQDPWRVAALLAVGLAQALQGLPAEAEASMNLAVERWERGSFANNAVCLALGHAAALALERGDRTAAERYARKARRILVANGLTEQPVAVVIDAVDARLAMTHHAADQARRDIAHAQRIRAKANHAVPWLAVRARLDLVRAHIALGDGGGSRTLMSEVREILALRPDLGTLVVEAEELGERVASLRGGVAGASTLTIAELRLLPLLTTHLTFREIGERLFVSQNTVKTQAISIYRKLDSASRSEAIERAVEIGLLESSGIPEAFIPPG